MPILVSLSAGALSALTGVLGLAFRARVLGYVRARYERAYRYENLSESDMNDKLPTMRPVVVVASGFVVVGAGFIAMAVYAMFVDLS
jgi:hypothetical protein